jgi:hypothetical protein
VRHDPDRPGDADPGRLKDLGHKDASITARLYAHVIAEAEPSEVEKLAFFPGSKMAPRPIGPQNVVVRD